jgi:hypothetical protein
MIRTTIVIVAALAAVLPAIPAQATGAPRTFLSAAGSDANNCTNVATPCRHLAAAFAATAADGEIYVLDPANYGSLTITHGVSIEGHGWASIAPVSGSAAITINAPGATDKINIIGVVLDGTALTGTTGIQFTSGGSLTVQDSVIRNFALNGINFAPNTANPSQIYVSNTLASDNGNAGIRIVPAGSGTTNGVLDHVRTENNGATGLLVDNEGTQTINITVTDSVSANNGSNGINSHSVGSPANIMVRNSTIANNGVSILAPGLSAGGTGASVRATRSTITGNGAGWGTTPGGQVTSFGDNDIIDNGSANNAPPSVSHE